MELFCGRGNGLHALEQLGFTRLEGVDLSGRLLAQYRGKAKCYEADCRKLPFADRSKDILIVQGGLHHLPDLPEDLEKTLAEMHRVVRKNGRLVIVEPWRTPFLTVAHLVSGESRRAPIVQQARCIGGDDALRTAHLRTMAVTAKGDFAARPPAFCSPEGIICVG